MMEKLVPSRAAWLAVVFNLGRQDERAGFNYPADYDDWTQDERDAYGHGRISGMEAKAAGHE